MSGIWGKNLGRKAVTAQMVCGEVTNGTSLHDLSILKSIFHPYIIEFPSKINPEFLKCIPLYKCQAVKTTIAHNCWLPAF
jgi:hypothetical protein